MMKKLYYRLMVLMSKRMLSCDEASFLASYRSDHRLRIVQWWRLKMHLLNCHLCRRYVNQVNQLNSTVENYAREWSEAPMIDHLSPEASLKIQNRVDQELNAN